MFEISPDAEIFGVPPLQKSRDGQCCVRLRERDVYVEVIYQGSNFGDAHDRRTACGGGFGATCEACE